jgi:HK97 family phage portal protein
VSIWRKTEQRALPQSIDPYGITSRPYYANYSGEIVSEVNVFASTAILSAVSLLADSIASMPIDITQRKANQIARLPVPSVFQYPNDKQNMFEFMHQTMCTLAIHGNAYIYAPRGKNGLPVEMQNIHPKAVKGLLETDTGAMVYQIGKQQFAKEDIKAIQWIVLAGQETSVSPIEALRNTIGTGLAMDRFLAQFYGEGATPSSVLETDGAITPEQAQQIAQNWEQAHYKHRKPAVLQGGLKWRSITTSAADMQMLEHKESIIRDIARVYRIPLHLIIGTGGDTQTYTNLEGTGAAFYKYTLLGWVRRLETAFSEFLPANQQMRFDATEFLRADLMTRVQAQTMQIANGSLTPNEAREIENREPYDDGNEFVRSNAVVPVGQDAVPPAK